LSTPTQVEVIRFVFWKLMTNDCTIGDQLKTANTAISGRANSRFETPPRRIHPRMPRRGRMDPRGGMARSLATSGGASSMTVMGRLFPEVPVE
jgi:hypothetical protein